MARICERCGRVHGICPVCGHKVTCEKEPAKKSESLKEDLTDFLKQDPHFRELRY